MLRFLILLIIANVTYAQTYSEPTRSDIQKANQYINNTFSKTNKLANDDDFLNDLRSHKNKLESITGDDLKNHFFDLDSITIDEDFKDDQYLSKNLFNNDRLKNHSRTNWTDAPTVMVSFSIPESYLKTIIKEASIVGSNVVIRGLIDDDFEKTILKLKELSNDIEKGNLKIDPTLFNRFSVKRVPTLILPMEPIKTCDGDGCDIPKHVRAEGTISIKYFLEKVSRLGNIEEKKVADNWLLKYEGESP